MELTNCEESTSDVQFRNMSQPHLNTTHQSSLFSSDEDDDFGDFQEGQFVEETPGFAQNSINVQSSLQSKSGQQQQQINSQNDPFGDLLQSNQDKTNTYNTTQNQITQSANITLGGDVAANQKDNSHQWDPFDDIMGGNATASSAFESGITSEKRATTTGQQNQMDESARRNTTAVANNENEAARDQGSSNMLMDFDTVTDASHNGQLSVPKQMERNTPQASVSQSLGQYGNLNIDHQKQQQGPDTVSSSLTEQVQMMNNSGPKYSSSLEPSSSKTAVFDRMDFLNSLDFGNGSGGTTTAHSGAETAVNPSSTNTAPKNNFESEDSEEEWGDFEEAQDHPSSTPDGSAPSFPTNNPTSFTEESSSKPPNQQTSEKLLTTTAEKTSFTAAAPNFDLSGTHNTTKENSVSQSSVNRNFVDDLFSFEPVDTKNSPPPINNTIPNTIADSNTTQPPNNTTESTKGDSVPSTNLQTDTFGEENEDDWGSFEEAADDEKPSRDASPVEDAEDTTTTITPSQESSSATSNPLPQSPVAPSRKSILDLFDDKNAQPETSTTQSDLHSSSDSAASKTQPPTKQSSDDFGEEDAFDDDEEWGDFQDASEASGVASPQSRKTDTQQIPVNQQQEPDFFETQSHTRDSNTSIEASTSNSNFFDDDLSVQQPISEAPVSASKTSVEEAILSMLQRERFQEAAQYYRQMQSSKRQTEAPSLHSRIPFRHTKKFLDFFCDERVLNMHFSQLHQDLAELPKTIEQIESAEQLENLHVNMEKYDAQAQKMFEVYAPLIRLLSTCWKQLNQAQIIHHKLMQLPTSKMEHLLKHESKLRGYYENIIQLDDVLHTLLRGVTKECGVVAKDAVEYLQKQQALYRQLIKNDLLSVWNLNWKTPSSTASSRAAARQKCALTGFTSLKEEEFCIYGGQHVWVKAANLWHHLVSDSKPPPKRLNTGGR